MIRRFPFSVGSFYVCLFAIAAGLWAFGFDWPLLAVGVAWCITLAGSWILEVRPSLRPAILRRRFQFNLRALLLLTAGVGLLLGAEMAMASPRDDLVASWRPSEFMRCFVVAAMMHVAMFIAGGAFIGWAIGMPTGRRRRYAAYGACIAALLIVGRVGWFVSDPNNWFPSQGRMEEVARKNAAERKAVALAAEKEAPLP